MLLTTTPIQPQLAHPLSKLPNCFVSGFHVQTVRRQGLSGQIGLPLLTASNNHRCLLFGNMFYKRKETRKNASRVA